MKYFIKYYRPKHSWKF